MYSRRSPLQKGFIFLSLSATNAGSCFRLASRCCSVKSSSKKIWRFSLSSFFNLNAACFACVDEKVTSIGRGFGAPAWKRPSRTPEITVPETSVEKRDFTVSVGEATGLSASRMLYMTIFLARSPRSSRSTCSSAFSRRRDRCRSEEEEEEDDYIYPARGG